MAKDVTPENADSVNESGGGKGHKAGCPVVTGPTGLETPAPPHIPSAAQDHVCGPDCQCGCEAGLTIPVRRPSTAATWHRWELWLIRFRVWRQRRLFQ